MIEYVLIGFGVLWGLLAIAVLVTDYRDSTIGWRLVPKILFLPILLVYEFTFALFVMPLLYGKNKWGYPGYILSWLLYAVLAVTLSWWIPYVGDNLNKLNRLANWFMGFESGQTVSSEVGRRIDAGKASWVACLHCRILAIYDKRGYHCSEKATRLF